MVIRSSRTIYMAIGEFTGPEVDGTRDKLEEWDRALARGTEPDAAAETLPSPARGIATRAGGLIRRFETEVGEECGAQVGGNSSPLANIDERSSISLENRDAQLFGPEVSELAAQIADTLEELLRALGATKTISGHVD